MPERFRQRPRPSVPATSVPAPGALIAGKYLVEGILGAGGMGVVLAARHLTLSQPVAIKILPIDDEHAPADAAERLLREARAAAALSDDHVVRVYDVGEDEFGKPFIVMERLVGCDLGALLDAQGPLPIGSAVALVQQAARAVAAAHRVGIVHRDLKPSNLFLSRRSDGSITLKVLDFGIAKSLRPETIAQVTLTGARMPLGSPAYMSPEQVRSAREVDTRTDIWSLGMILYELLTGKVAFEASTLPGICAAIAADTPAPPSARRAEVPPELDAIVLRCLHKDASQRFATAEELMAVLSPYAGAPELMQLIPSSLSPETLPTMEYVPEQLEPPMQSRKGVSSRFVFEVDSHVRTLASESPPALVASNRGAASDTQVSPSLAPRAMRRWVAVAGVTVALVAGAVALFTFAPWEATPVRSEDLATLDIDSVPPGARVSDARTRYGKTPVRVALRAVPGSTEPHVFTLELEGYRPFVLQHRSPQPGNYAVRAELVPVERAELRATAAQSASPRVAQSVSPVIASAAPGASPAPPGTGLQRSAVRHPPPLRSAPPPASATPVEIRLSR